MSMHRCLNGLAAALIAFGLTGCVAPVQPPTPMASPTPPAAVDNSLPPMVVDGQPERTPHLQAPASPHNRFAFRDTPIDEALRLLFANSDLNLIIAPELTSTVTADFKDATPELVLDALLKTHGLTITYGDRFARIGRESSRTYKLDYVAGSQQQEVWDDIEGQIGALLSANGKLTVSPITGTLVVSDDPGHLDQVEAHLVKLREIVSRQVMIETKVIEVTLNNRFLMGIDYGLFPRTVGLNTSGGSGRASGGNALSQTLSSSLKGFQLGFLRAGDFSFLLDALHTQGQVNMLSAPKVSTLNNRTATINVTEQIPVVSLEVVGGQQDATSTRERYSVEFRQAGIELDVTPQISSDGTMTVVVHPRVTELSGSVTTPDGLQTLPLLNLRETESVLRVRDGESILLGGFIQNRRREDVTKVPFLGDLPGIGALFRRTDQQVDRVELVILVTPRILDHERIRTTVQNSLSDLRRLAQPFQFGTLGHTHFEPTGSIRTSGFTTALLSSNGPLEDGGFAPVTRKGLAHHLLGVGLAHRNQGDETAAIAAMQQAIRLDSSLTEAHYQLAYLYAVQGRERQAMDEFMAFGAATPTHPWGLNQLALALIANHSFDSAITVLQQAIAHFPTETRLLTNLGVAYLGQQRLDLAEAAFRLASREHPERIEPLLNQAEMMAADGRLEDALVMFNRALEQIPAGNPELFVQVSQRRNSLTRQLAPVISDAAPETTHKPLAPLPADNPAGRVRQPLGSSA